MSIAIISILAFCMFVVVSVFLTPLVRNDEACKPEQVKQTCSWCGKFIGGDATATTVSHGVCSECADKLKEQENQSTNKT